MKRERTFVLVSIGVVLAAACGGGGTPTNGSDAGGTGSSGGSSGSSSGSGGSSGSAGTVDGGGTPGTGSIVCGTETCMGPQQVCCVGANINGGDTCTDRSACPNAAELGNLYTCTSAANCADAGVCCVALGAGSLGSDVALCQSTCVNSDAGAFQVCQTSAECPDGGSCKLIATRADVRTCQ